MSDLVITTPRIVECVFSMPLRRLQGFINSVFKFT
ncbi:transposase [Candidatus Enterovibrio altilux]